MSSKPALFTDPLFLRSRKFALSTSNVSVSSSASFGGYAPFFPGGYGVCYSLQEGMINLSISSVKGTRTDAAGLRGAIETSFLDVYDLILQQEALKDLASLTLGPAKL